MCITQSFSDRLLRCARAHTRYHPSCSSHNHSAIVCSGALLHMHSHSFELPLCIHSHYLCVFIRTTSVHSFALPLYNQSYCAFIHTTRDYSSTHSNRVHLLAPLVPTQLLTPLVLIYSHYSCPHYSYTRCMNAHPPCTYYTPFQPHSISDVLTILLDLIVLKHDSREGSKHYKRRLHWPPTSTPYLLQRRLHWPPTSTPYLLQHHLHRPPTIAPP